MAGYAGGMRYPRWRRAANHGCYKTLLFLEAGVVEHAAGTRDMDRLGGLVQRLPRSAVIAFMTFSAPTGSPSTRCTCR
jgi:NADH:ubiquinone oxidoreductase subunit 5 (subunit L)/multisubunit Na+/H+ antiporter MnhA subunit